MIAMLLLVLSAPAPLPKPPPPLPAIRPGSWVMHWQGVDAPTAFHADGFYSCNWHGTWWHGQWMQEGGVLTVEEWPLDQPARRHRWAVRLRDGTTGTLSGVHAWRLRSPPAGPET